MSQEEKVFGQFGVVIVDPKLGSPHELHIEEQQWNALVVKTEQALASMKKLRRVDEAAIRKNENILAKAKLRQDWAKIGLALKVDGNSSTEEWKNEVKARLKEIEKEIYDSEGEEYEEIKKVEGEILKTRAALKKDLHKQA